VLIFRNVRIIVYLNRSIFTRRISIKDNVLVDIKLNPSSRIAAKFFVARKLFSERFVYALLSEVSYLLLTTRERHMLCRGLHAWQGVSGLGGVGGKCACVCARACVRACVCVRARARVCVLMHLELDNARAQFFSTISGKDDMYRMSPVHVACRYKVE
jgi:hypothetical protein